MICSIFACDANGGIGKDGSLPWPNDSEDMRWFRTNTMDHVVVMGKKTWNDPYMPKPLIGRISVVVARNGFSGFDSAHMVVDGNNIEDSISHISSSYPDKIIWIIGGAAIIDATKHLVDQVYLTRFDQPYDCDVIIDLNEYLDGFVMIDEHQGKDKRFQRYERISRSA